MRVGRLERGGPMRWISVCIFALCVGCGNSPNTGGVSEKSVGPDTMETPGTTARSSRFVITQQSAQSAQTSRSNRFSLDANPGVSTGTSRNGEFVMEAWVMQ